MKKLTKRNRPEQLPFILFIGPQYTHLQELPQMNRLRIPQGPDMRDLRFATTGGSPIWGVYASLRQQDCQGSVVKLSKQFLEFINAQTGILNNTSHSVGIYGVCSGNGDNSIAVGHCNVLALPDNPNPVFLKAFTALWWFIPGNLGIDDFYVPSFLIHSKFINGLQIGVNSVFDIFQRLNFWLSLRPAAR